MWWSKYPLGGGLFGLASGWAVLMFTSVMLGNDPAAADADDELVVAAVLLPKVVPLGVPLGAKMALMQCASCTNKKPRVHLRMLG